MCDNSLNNDVEAIMTTRKIYNIDFRSLNPINSQLSNLYPHPFVMDGVQCGSMEGFLQSLKFSDRETQLSICPLSKFKAQRAGKESNWSESKILHWDGSSYHRMSDSYLQLLQRAYNTCVSSNQLFADSLIATIDGRLDHSIGNTNPQHTIITKLEFINILTEIRHRLVWKDVWE